MGWVTGYDQKVLLLQICYVCEIHLVLPIDVTVFFIKAAILESKTKRCNTFDKMEKIFEQEINDHYVSHAIWFPEQFKITGKDDKSVWCLQRKIAEVFTIVFIENPRKLSKPIAFSLVVVLHCAYFSV